MSTDALPPSPAAVAAPSAGIFDSGLGGLSVLQALHRTLPGLPLRYVADSGYAPYGERSEAFITDRSLAIAAHLIEGGASLLVVACNTATAVAVAAVRERWPGLPVVGVEPAIKPAVLASLGKRIGVMATPTTLRSAKFERLLATHRGDAEVLLQPCPGLAGQIERGDLNAPELIALIDAFCAPLREARADTVVLGCTHYPFVREHIQCALGPDVRLIDTAEPVARQTARLLQVNAGDVRYQDDGTVRVLLETTGDAAHLQEVAARWLPFPCAVEAAAIG